MSSMRSIHAFVEQALEYFLEADGSEPMSDAEFQEVQDAIREAPKSQDPTTDGLSLEDCDRACGPSRDTAFGRAAGVERRTRVVQPAHHAPLFVDRTPKPMSCRPKYVESRGVGADRLLKHRQDLWRHPAGRLEVSCGSSVSPRRPFAWCWLSRLWHPRDRYA